MSQQPGRLERGGVLRVLLTLKRAALNHSQGDNMKLLGHIEYFNPSPLAKILYMPLLSK